MRITLAENKDTLSIGSSALHQQKLLSLPLVAGAIMIWASVSPWLHDPLGSLTTSWQLPVDPGWQIRVPALNYGLLCTAIAIGCWLLVIVRYLPFVNCFGLPQLRYKALICLVPVLLFPGQMLCCDFARMASMARHEQQALLIH
ncbi:MAG TPA: hypothetical protein VGN34_05700, partial [Ktedonobacteraceae bacterium]